VTSTCTSQSLFSTQRVLLAYICVSLRSPRQNVDEQLQPQDVQFLPQETLNVNIRHSEAATRTRTSTATATAWLPKWWQRRCSSLLCLPPDRIDQPIIRVSQTRRDKDRRAPLTFPSSPPI
jgi:hypothetical protein